LAFKIDCSCWKRRVFERDENFSVEFGRSMSGWLLFGCAKFCYRMFSVG